MTFDLTPEQKILVQTAKTATALPPKAADAVLVIEERASSDPAEAARFGFEGVGGRSNVTAALLPGLEGSEAALASIPEANRLRARLMAAAVALGVGRAAVTHAVAALKKRDIKPGPETTVPHWTLADGATDVQAARLLTYSAAQSLDRGEQAAELIARALEFASNAALRAVDAAIRVEGVGGYTKNGLLERLSRDARTLQVILR
jgi:alkylation response protein AidB-like acyl-CoA dehydrogenase